MALNLTAKLKLDGAGFKAGLSQAESSVKTWARRMAGIVSVAAIGRGVFSQIKNAGKIRDMSAAVGLSTDQWQKYSYAVEQSGGTIESVVKAIKTISMAQYGAIRGQKEYIDTFRALGISVEDSIGMTAQQLFERLAGDVEKGKLGINDLGALTRVLGRGVEQLMPAFQEGFARVANSAAAAGAVIQDTTVYALASMGDELTLLEKQFNNMFSTAIIKSGEFFREMWQGLRWLSSMNVADTKALTEWGKPGAMPFDKTTKDIAERRKNAEEAAINSLVEEDQLRKEAVNAIRENRRKIEASASGREEWLQKMMEGLGGATTAGGGSGAGGFKTFSDNLARIGGFVGGVAPAEQRMLTATTEIRNHVANLDRRLANIENKFAVSGW